MDPVQVPGYFYPRSPCGERRVTSSAGTIGKSFLSTLSLRRATSKCLCRPAYTQISIHALLAESDSIAGRITSKGTKFLSTLSLRRATARRALGFVDPDISIHALLAESDDTPSTSIPKPGNFYPRSPCGERLKRAICRIKVCIFLSTLSLRRATAPSQHPCLSNRNFYPRSPCGERRNQPLCARPTRDFYPRSPCGERLLPVLFVKNVLKISIHALLAESDLFEYIQAGTGILFLSTLSLRRATGSICFDSRLLNYFYPRSPCGERQSSRAGICEQIKFLSTLSLRRATIFFRR